VHGAASHDPQQARFALVKALAVEGVGQVEELIVEVMADLVEEGAEKGLDGDDVVALRGSHPDRDAIEPAVVAGHVDAVQLATVIVRTHALDVHGDRRDPEPAAKAVDELLGRGFGRATITRRKRVVDCLHRLDQIGPRRNRQRGARRAWSFSRRSPRSARKRSR